MKSLRSLPLVATLLVVAGSSAAGATDEGSGVAVRDPAADLKRLVKDGDRASARGDWEAAAHDYGEAAKLAPGDTRLRTKLRRALEHRASICEIRAANPPAPPESGFSDGPSDSVKVMLFKNLRWGVRLKREALDARADAEAARAKPDNAKIARLRDAAAEKKKDEDRLTTQIAEEQTKGEATRIEDEKAMQKAFEGVGGVTDEMKDGISH